LIDLTGRYTVPQIMIDETPIGGFDELAALAKSGELDTLLAR
jgi:glutaredoxin 3